MAKTPAKKNGGAAKPAQTKEAASVADNGVLAPDLIIEEVDIAVETAPEPVEVAEPSPVVENIAPPKAPVEPTPMPAPEPIESHRDSIFLPAVLGGVVAAGLGYAVATYLQAAEDVNVTEQLASQQAAISALQTKLDDLPDMPDLTPLETTQADLATKVADTLTRMTDISDRIGVLEKQPSGDGTLTGTAMAAYQAELDQLREELQATAAATSAQLATTQQEAAAIEQNAIAAAQAATARAALARVQGAVESGAAMGPALSDLAQATGQDIPAALSAVADGVPTLASLQDTFPEVARAALSSARAAGVDGAAEGGFTAFFRNQFDVRSVAPKEGDDADAVLSRVEAAVKAGRLSDALAEAEALPEVSRAEMTDWLGKATARVAASDAIETISGSLNDN